MRAYIFGNGASVACGQHTGADFLKWGLAEAKLVAQEGGTTSNIRRCIRTGLETTLQRLDEMRGLLSGDPQGVYWPRSVVDYTPYVHGQLDVAAEATVRGRLEGILDGINFSSVVEEAVRVAADGARYTYLSSGQKQATLLGPHSGNFLDALEDLQRDIVGLASNSVSTPNHYDDFVKLLTAGPGALVINLNWDTLFESAYRRVLAKEPQHVYLADSVSVPTGLPLGDHQLSKPHGSLEYLACQSPAHSNPSGCFRITVVPGKWNFPTASSTESKCRFACGYGANLRPFLHPYARVIRSRRASPFVAASLEALKPVLFDVNEIVSIGYSFSCDSVGWIDDDLLPIFLGKRVHLVGQDIASATTQAVNVRSRIGVTNVAPIDVAGFSGYLVESQKERRLLP